MAEPDFDTLYDTEPRASGRRIDYLGASIYRANFTLEAFTLMSDTANDADWAARVKPLLDRSKVIEPLFSITTLTSSFGLCAPPGFD